MSFTDWLFSQAIWDLDWIDIVILAPFATYYLIRGILNHLAYREYYKTHPRPRPQDPDMDPCGNNNIRRNFWDYM